MDRQQMKQGRSRLMPMTQKSFAFEKKSSLEMTDEEKEMSLF